MDTCANMILEREAQLRTDRSSVEQVWDEIAQYVIPRKTFYMEQVKPQVERKRLLLDSTAPRALEMFASFLHTLLNNPATKWFKLGVVSGDPNVAERQWLEAAEDVILAQMAGNKARLYTRLHEIYLELGAFGAGVLYEDIVDNVLMTRTFSVADTVWAEGENGNVNAVFRQFRMTPNQARERQWLDEFTSSESQRVKETKTIRFIHAVFPASELFDLARHVPDGEKQRAILAEAEYFSVWVNADDVKVVEYGIAHEFPYQIPRWYTVRNDPTGRSPAMTVLSDIKLVNRMQETALRAAEKLADPPLTVPESSLLSPIRAFPGGVTFTENNAELRPLMPPGASRVEFAYEMIKGVQQAIREGFFTPLFVTPDNPVKTATQVLQEVDERNRAISPMIIRLQDELFHRMITRCYNLLLRARRLPPNPPASLTRQRLQLEYVSPLTSSRKQQEGLGIMRIIESMLPWTQIDPGVLDIFKPDEVARVVHSASGAPASILRTQREIDQVRQAQLQQEQQAQQAQQAQVQGSLLTDAVTAGAKVQAAQQRR